MGIGEVAAAVSIGNALFGGGGSSGGGSPPQQSREATAESIAASKQARGMSQDLFDYHVKNYRPLEQSAIQLAQEAGSPEMQEQKAGQAGATVQQSFTNANEARKRSMLMYGSKPDSGNMQEMDRENAVAQAGATSGAMNLARQNERAYGLSAKTAVADVGRNITSNAIGADNAASNAAAVGIKGAASTQAVQDVQNTNIGNVLGAIKSFTAPPSSSYTVAQNYTPSADASTGGAMDQGNTGYNPYLYQADYSGGYYRKGGLAKPPRHPAGGKVTGPGTGTSDSVPVMIDGKTPGALSNGEYVVNAKAVKKHGVDKLDAINAKGLPAGHKMKSGTPVAYKDGGKVHHKHVEDDADDDEDNEYALGGAVMQRSFARPNRHQGEAHG